MNDFKFRRSESDSDGKKLKSLLNTIFDPEKVGDFADVLFHHFPVMDRNYWFIAEDAAASEMVASFTLVPWAWEFEGISLKVAEMGLVGTLENYRGRGLMKQLNGEFDRTLHEEGFDLAVIQGIPGFYQNFGYHYSITLENHFNVALDSIGDNSEKPDSAFRLADANDIPYLMEQDEKYRKRYSVSARRDNNLWRYLLNESKMTEYGSDFWIMEDTGGTRRCYLRIPYYGFGSGLIVSEASEDMDAVSFHAVLVFCRQLAVERNKPFIRFNLHNNSNTAEYLKRSGVEESYPYAWQIKIPDKIRLLNSIKPVLEKRLAKSPMNSFSGTLRFDLYREGIDLTWRNGRLISADRSNDGNCDNTFCINEDLFPALCLGYRSWRELQYTRPDIFPAPQYTHPYETRDTDCSGQLVNILFPKTDSWIYMQY